MKKSVLVGMPVILTAAFLAASLFTARGEARLSPLEELGKRLFFDITLSSPAGQDCSACHRPAAGFSGPDSKINQAGSTYEGAVKGRFGNRRPPTAAYAGASPPLHRDEEGNFVGGLFWDGRATGAELGDPLAEQAMGPFLNPLEQNLPDVKSLIRRIEESEYAPLFEKVWGKGSLDSEKDPDGAFEKAVRAIAAYERSAELNPFNSKFDDFWRAARAQGLDVEALSESNESDYRNLGLSDRELHGLALFITKGLCAECHVLTSVDGNPPLFTDFTYDNLGVPRNPENLFYVQSAEFNPDGKEWVDKGLGGFLETVEHYRPYAEENYGKHKVPTLRNVDERPSPDFVKSFMHNGCFKSLEEVVQFYNTRDVPGTDWAPPEIEVNINREELGNLELTEDEEMAIVDFMKTLTDRRQALPDSASGSRGEAVILSAEGGNYDEKKERS